MEYLIAVDLEGIGGVVGLPNQTLNGSPDYEVAKENAVKEINAATKALFDGGATKVCVWDNHGGGGNLDFSKIDPRVEKIDWKDVDLLRRYVSDRGKILPRRITGTKAIYQRELAVAIKRARHMALLPFVKE